MYVGGEMCYPHCGLQLVDYAAPHDRMIQLQVVAWKKLYPASGDCHLGMQNLREMFQSSFPVIATVSIPTK